MTIEVYITVREDDDFESGSWGEASKRLTDCYDVPSKTSKRIP
jgi:hypothetical protein